MATYRTHEHSAPIAPAGANAIRIRRMLPSDATELERFYAELSVDSRFLRFFAGTRGISHGESVSFCSPDHEHREGFVALAADEANRPRIVGHLCLEPAGPHRAEVAVAVADSLQHQGIGRRLMEAGIEWARSVGIEQFTATTLATNVGIRRLLGNLGYPSTVSWSSPAVADVVIDLNLPRRFVA